MKRLSLIVLRDSLLIIYTSLGGGGQILIIDIYHKPLNEDLKRN